MIDVTFSSPAERHSISRCQSPTENFIGYCTYLQVPRYLSFTIKCHTSAQTFSQLTSSTATTEQGAASLHRASCARHLSFAPPTSPYRDRQPRIRRCGAGNVRALHRRSANIVLQHEPVCAQGYTSSHHLWFPMRTPSLFGVKTSFTICNTTLSSRYIAPSIICAIAVCLIAIGHDDTIEICDLSRQCKPKAPSPNRERAS